MQVESQRSLQVIMSFYIRGSNDNKTVNSRPKIYVNRFLAECTRSEICRKVNI